MLTKHTVIAILEAKPGQETALENALAHVAELSRSEDSNIEYRLHKDINKPQQFILYENWENKEKHAEQFNKPYIMELGAKLDDLLAKPLQVFFAEEMPR